MRTAEICRKTKETEIKISVTLDRRAEPADVRVESVDVRTEPDDVQAEPANGKINVKCGFLSHMLTLFAFHSGFTLNIEADGDTETDYHHLTEDLGIVLGCCIKQALGDGCGIRRYASAFLPMDETLVLVALDVGGRVYLNYDVNIAQNKVGDFDTELCEEFLAGLCRSLGLTLHVKQFYGSNAHHIIEAIFKGLGRALGDAVRIDAAGYGGIPSSKGLI